MTGSRTGLRALQEPVLRWTATAVCVICAITFCIALGDVPGTSALGLLFGALFAAVPTGWLWVRELNEVDIAHERALIQGETQTWTASVAADDDDSPPPPVSTDPALPAPWRPREGGD